MRAIVLVIGLLIPSMAFAEAERKCVDFSAMNVDEKTNSAVLLHVTNAAQPDAKFTIVDLDAPRTVCIVKVGDECILKYDGETQNLVSTRSLIVNVKAK